MSFRSWRTERAPISAAITVVRCALVVRVLDEWWSYLPAGSIADQVRDLGLSYGESGWLLALLTLGGVAASPVAALADRGNRRVLAAGGAALIAVGLAMFAVAAPFPVLAVAAAVMGGASDVMISPLEASLAELADDGLDRLLGRQHLITWCGDLLAPALLALGAATAVGWRGVFAITAVAFVVYAVVLARTNFPAPRHLDDAADTAPSAMGRALALLRMPDLWRLTVAEFALMPLDEAFLGFAVARSSAAGSGATAQGLAVGLVVGGWPARCGWPAAACAARRWREARRCWCSVR
jgi:MFS family permease